VLERFIERPTDWRYGYELSRETGLNSATLYPILMRLTAVFSPAFAALPSGKFQVEGIDIAAAADEFDGERTIGCSITPHS
jgi:hypothetical protein